MATSNDLEKQIEALARSFASAVIQALKSSRLEDIFAQGSDPPAWPRKRVGRPPGPSRKATIKRTTAMAVMTYVKGHPGHTGEYIRKALGLSRNRWSPAIAHCIEARLLRRDGELRNATYFPL